MSNLNLRFLPWLRRGLARSIAGGTTNISASIDFNLTVGGQAVNQTLRMRGPGDVLGIDPSQIIRVEPRAGTVDFEPNYFPAVEFATPDLPWMFTPTAPDKDNHLLPWLTLITVRDDLAVIQMRAGAPLPVLTAPLTELPSDLSEMWAWAHVQTTNIYADGKLSDALNDAPEAFISRILSPRNLQPDTGYVACIVPTFEAGRRAGLGLPIAAEIGQKLAWDTSSGSSVELPVYYSWSFRTSQVGDFETLVSRLQACELDASVGRRKMDISDIGIPLPREVPDTTYFFGALVSPTAMRGVDAPSKPTPDFPFDPDPKDLPDLREVDPLRKTLHDFLTPDIGDPDDGPYDYRSDDPVVTPPIYGREQLKGKALPPPASDRPIFPDQGEPIWYSEVNTLPRTRGAAGLGTRIVRKHQEDFMSRAWRNVGALRTINQMLQQATYASLIANRWQSRVAQLEAGEALQVTRSAHARILPQLGKTIWGRVHTANVPRGLISMDFQRMVRTGGVVHHTLRLTTGLPVIQPELRRMVVVDASRLMTLSAHKIPSGMQLDSLQQTNSIDTPTSYHGQPIAGSIGQISTQLDSILSGGLTATEAPQASNAVLTAHKLAADYATYLDALEKRGYTLTPQMTTTRTAAKNLVTRANQYVNAVNKGTAAGVAQIQAVRNQAVALQTALNDWRKVETAPGGTAVIDMGTPVIAATSTLEPIASALQAALTPDQTISAYLQSRISLNGVAWGQRLIPSRFIAAPLFEDAIYRYITELSPEYMLPGIGEIPQNTVGLVQVNGEFVEAALLGTNHEMSREMRWREYPADLSGTWFRRFWNATQDDIAPINSANWPGENTLGENLIGQLSDASLVLLIKGEILQRYPNIAVYALPAIVTSVRSERGLRRVRVPKEPEAPNYPVFSGQLGNGVKFFGFDKLTVLSALGTATERDNSTDGGYFFVLQEQPTEPRFGLNEYDPTQSYRAADLTDWSGLSWGHFMKGDDPDSPTYLSTGGKFNNVRLPDSADSTTNSTWGNHASGMARIVLQRPVRMMVHASVMLPAIQPEKQV